jgi:exopolysaccharide biosynthesis operon protein EpsL
MKKTTLHAAVLLALAAPGVALAQHFDAVDTIPSATSGRFPAYPVEATRPTEIYVRGGILRDDNVFRLSNSANASAILGTSDRSETITRAGVGIRHEQRIIGRQSVRLTANIDRYDYKRFTLLNHTEYGFRGEWLWEFTNDLSGTAGFERRHRLVDLAQRQTPVKDMIDEDHAFLTAAYLLGPRVRLRGGLDAARGRHSDAAANAADVRTTTATGAVEYVTPLGNAIGVEGRRTKGNVPLLQAVGPAAVLVDNDFTETEVAGVLTWTATPQLQAVGRLGHTKREHVQFPVRDFSGSTWRATVGWTPFNKTGFDFNLYKEPRTIVDIAASYVIVKGVSFGPRWAPTEKLVFTALLVNEQQDFRGDPTIAVVPGTAERQETVRTVRFGASWEPLRFSQVQLGWDHGKRSSNTALRDYDYDAVMLNLRLAF